MRDTVMSDPKKLQSVTSHLLTQEENQMIISSLGKQNTSLATAVVQLFLTEEPYHSSWTKKCCGVICFVKDCERRSYFLKVFDMDKSGWVWEQELYNPFVYEQKFAFFHTFEADNCVAGLNFCDTDEAMQFQSAVQKKLQMREERRQARKRAQQQSVQPTNAGIVAARAKSQSNQSLSNGRDERKEKKKKKKLTKEDISCPSNFKHVHHVGWHPEKGFSVDTTELVDKDLQDFFSMAGVSEKDLKDVETRSFIYDFIANHGGVERAKKEIELKSVPPPVPMREVPQTPRSTRVARSAAPPPPPPPPTHQNQASNSPKLGNIPPPPSLGCSGGAPPPPPPPPPMPPLGSMGGAPPPPPPPLPAVSGKASLTTATRQNNPPSNQMDNRSALLEQIKKGRELNHVEINGNESESAAQPDNERGALLNQIRQGVVLKPVAEDARPAPAPSAEAGLAGALARALAERSRAIQQTDESGSSSDEDDADDWD